MLSKRWYVLKNGFSVLALFAILLSALSFSPVLAATNIAQGKPASSDGAQAANPAASGNDGSATTRWSAVNSNANHWWKVDLGASFALSGSEVMWEKSGQVYRYKVEVSTDNTNWTLKVDKTANTSTSQTQTDNFAATARYVRITVTGLPATNVWASFFEFRVFDSGSGPTPTRTNTPAGPTPTATATRTATPGTGGGPAVDPALRALCTGTSPIACHFGSRFPAGNYDVTVVLGGSTAGVTSVQAEARRNLLGPISTAAGTLSTQTFTVNVREPEGQPTGQGGTGTPGLDLYFSGSAPLLNGIGIAPAASSRLVIYLAGDSTVCDQPTVPYTAWGQILPQYFKLGTSVANYGDSGESSGSFLNAAALFPTMKPLVRANDFVFIQFGHNDKDTTKAAYQANLTSMINGVRQQGGIPVLVTPPVRRLFDSNGKLTPTALHVNNLGVDLPAAMKEVATANNVQLIDLTAKSKVLVEGLGPTASAPIYLTVANDGVNDSTHFSAYGAGQMASLVLQGIRELNLSLASRLR